MRYCLSSRLRAHLGVFGCVVALAYGAHGCGDGGAGGVGVTMPNAVYDVAVEGRTGAFVGEMTREGDAIQLEVETDAADVYRLAGKVDDGRIELTGEAIHGGDVVSEATGTLVATQKTSGFSIEGELRSGDGEAIQIRMERPQQGTPLEFSGLYRFEFVPSLSGCSCTSASDLMLSAGQSGIAQLEATADLSQQSDVGVFEGGRCRISPNGELWCNVTYQVARDINPSEPNFGMRFEARLRGTLKKHSDAISGNGIVRVFLSYAGNWNAGKM